MRKSIIITAVVGLLLPQAGAATARAADATIYYVDCSAAVNGTGTQESPFNTPATAYQPGDTILFKRGATCAGGFAPTGSGLAGSPVVVDAYGDAAAAKPVVDGGVHLSGVQFWELRNLTVTGAGIHIDVRDVGTAKHYRLSGLSVKDVTGDGIRLEVLPGSVRSNIDDVVLDGNDVSGAGGNGVVVDTTVNAVIQKSTVSGSGGAGIVAQNATGTVVQSNEISGSAGPALKAGSGTTGTVFQYDYTHGNGGMVSLAGTGAVTRYNISQNDRGTILRGAGATGAAVFNNTVYLASGSTTDLVGEDVDGNEVTVQNNIFDNQGTGGYAYSGAGATWHWSNNLFHGNHPANEPADPRKLLQDPGLTAPGSGGSGIASAAAYKLSSTSPARGVGTAVGGNGGKDFFGSALPAAGCAPDLGAHQRNPSLLCLAVNYVGNFSFENGTLAPWTAGTTGTVTLGKGGVAGSTAAKLSTFGAGVQQVVVDLRPGTTYTLLGWVQPADWQGDTVRMGVRDFGGTEVFADNSYPIPMQQSVTFTTGATDTRATIYCTKSAGYAAGSCDNFSLNVAATTATP